MARCMFLISITVVRVGSYMVGFCVLFDIGMNVLYLMHTWARILQRMQIATLNIAIKDMWMLARYYNNIPRPLVVIFLVGPMAFYEFSQNTGSLNMSSFAWLVIFISTPRYTSIDYCHTPRGNLFHLSFDTEMLVLCYPDPILREWYSVDGHTTDTYKLAKWTRLAEQSPLSTVELLTNLSLYERRNDLKGKVLRGVAVKNSILVTCRGDKLEGYFSTVISELQNALNFTLKIVAEDREYGSFNAITNSWSGAIRFIASGMLDLGVADFSMTNKRMNYVDYMIPIITTRSCLYLKQPEIFAVKWFAYFKAFNHTVWESMLAVFVIAVCIVTFMRSRVELSNTTQIMFDEVFRMLGIVCQQGLIELPCLSSLRIAYFAMLVSTVVLIAAYSASLIGFLTAYVPALPFRTIDEFIGDGTYNIIVLRGSAYYDMFYYSKDPVSKKIVKLLKPKYALPYDIKSGFEQICRDPKLAFYSDYNANLQKVAIGLHIPCKLVCISVGPVNSLSLILSKENQYTTVLNYHLHKLLNSGVLNRFKNDVTYQEASNFQPVGFGSIASVLLILVCGAALAILLLFVEICYYKCRGIASLGHSLR